jgi:hypothetical protein
MSCCLESAIINALRALECTPIKSENHFILERKCSDCLPYVVINTVTTAGLRTSSAVQKNSSVTINAYFSTDKEQQAFAYRDLAEAWLNASGCLDLGDCGCFCVQGAFNSRVNPAQGGTIRYGLTFSGSYHPSEAGSLSGSV